MKIKNILLTLAAVCGLFIASNASATCSNYATYVDGQVLTASSLNSLQTNYTNCVNAVLDGDTFTGNMSWHSGTDALFYSDTGSSLTGAIYGEDGDIMGAPRDDGAYGLTLSLSAGTLTIQCEGAACSATNPGHIRMASTTAGAKATLRVTAGGEFNDDAHASSDLTNSGWGVTESQAWAQDVPFFLYAVNRANSAIDGADGSSAFFLARNNILSVTPSSSANIGDTGAIPTSEGQNNILILDDVSIANYTSLPAQLIGAIRMRWLDSTADWTVQTLGNTDGIGREQLEKTFKSRWTMVAAQNGAAGGTYWRDNGGTAVQFTTSEYYYFLRSDGIINAIAYFNGDPGTDGAGAVTAILALPTAVASSTNDFYHPAIFVNSATGGQRLMTPVTPQGNAYTQFLEADGTPVQNGDFGNGNRTVGFRLEYQAF